MKSRTFRLAGTGTLIKQLVFANMRVAIQGERGAYSEEAAIQHFPFAEIVSAQWFHHAFQLLMDGQVAAAVVPIENSHAGSINDVYDLLLKHDVTITGEIDLAVQHCLLACPGVSLDAIRKVYSHPQAIAQCEEFLTRLGVERVAMEDTAGSARLISSAGWKDAAAIAGRRAADIYGLEILAQRIQTTLNNRTRFIVVRRPSDETAQQTVTGRKTSLIFVTRHRPGSLYRCLGTLATRNINLLKIESRPFRLKPWHYVFYLDVEGSAEEPAVEDALRELRSHAEFVKILGSYPRASNDVES